MQQSVRMGKGALFIDNFAESIERQAVSDSKFLILKDIKVWRSQ